MVSRVWRQTYLDLPNLTILTLRGGTKLPTAKLLPWGSFTAGKPPYIYTRFKLCVRTAGVFPIDGLILTIIQHNNPYIVIFARKKIRAARLPMAKLAAKLSHIETVVRRDFPLRNYTVAKFPITKFNVQYMTIAFLMISDKFHMMILEKLSYMESAYY